jgi:predicted RNA-binding protein YlqC (UPF0109 family)
VINFHNKPTSLPNFLVTNLSLFSALLDITFILELSYEKPRFSNLQSLCKTCVSNSSALTYYHLSEALAEGKFELRLLIPTKAAGAVIGKGGEYIKAMREKVGFLDINLCITFLSRKRKSCIETKKKEFCLPV